MGPAPCRNEGMIQQGCRWCASPFGLDAVYGKIVGKGQLGRFKITIMNRTFVIGDIHGCLIPFETLLDKIQLASRDQLILLGDLVDRGPDSAGVVRRAMAL